MALLSVLSLPALGAPAQKPPSARCADVEALVEGASAADLKDICAGASAALGFLAGHRVFATEPVVIEVTARIPPEAGPTAAGCYIENRRRVFVLPYARFRQHKTWFGVAIDRAVYRALAAHESAHAVAACNFKIANPSIQAKEYLAYAVMFSTMPTALRAKALAATATEGFTSLDRFTPLLYMFNPMRFGAEAYRHFTQVPEPSALIQQILAGQALTD